MISKKKKICIDCNTSQFIFSNKRCRVCASKLYIKPKAVIKPKENKVDINNYFTDKLIQLNKTRISEESGQKIPYPTRANICHILDKSRHPSVAYHPQNYVFLTIDEHSRFDQLLFAHRFEDLKKEYPNSWGKVLERLSYFINDCLENTKLKNALLKLI